MGYRKVYWEFGTSAKASAVQVYSAELSAGNFATEEALRAAFESAVDAVSLGNDGSEQFIAVENAVAKNPSTNPLAQRENKWLVSAMETNGNAVTFTIPCADLSLLGEDGETMDTGLTVYDNLVAAIEAFVLSNDGEAVTVTSIKFRARTL